MLSLVLPTFNERKNLPTLLQAVSEVLAGKPHEIIIVDDDSPDRTWEEAESMRAAYPALRVLRRVGKKGLSSAVVDGFAMAKGEVLMVMDSDLQHDPKLMLALWEAVQNGAVIAVASRYMKGGSVGEWVTGRRIISKTATYLAEHLPNVRSTDPMSGFFALRQDAFAAMHKHLRPTGFKILLEVLAFLPQGSRISEVPLVFRQRLHGESKLNMKVEMEFLCQLLRIAGMRLLGLLGKKYIMVLGIAYLVFGMTYGWRVLRLSPLYFSATVRSNVQSAMTTLAKEQGWMLSDVSLQAVTAVDMRVLHQPHRRGTHAAECWQYAFANSALERCI